MKLVIVVDRRRSDDLGGYELRKSDFQVKTELLHYWDSSVRAK